MVLLVYGTSSLWYFGSMVLQVYGTTGCFVTNTAVSSRLYAKYSRERPQCSWPKYRMPCHRDIFLDACHQAELIML